jgi:biopolymer transport protein ExbD
MSVRIDKGRLGHGLEMAPMIDIVFLLMIFFLVASRLDEDARSLAVVLPQAAAARPLTSRPRELVVTIDREGGCFVGTRPVTPEELRSVLRQAAADNPGTQTVVVRADEETRHRFVVAVMDACVQAGIDDYQVQAVTDAAATEAPPGEAAP